MIILPLAFFCFGNDRKQSGLVLVHIATVYDSQADIEALYILKVAMVASHVVATEYDEQHISIDGRNNQTLYPPQHTPLPIN